MREKEKRQEKWEKGKKSGGKRGIGVKRGKLSLFCFPVHESEKALSPYIENLKGLGRVVLNGTRDYR